MNSVYRPLWVAGISSLFFLLPKPVAAQTLSLSVSPPLVEIRMQPDKTAIKIYTVKNTGEETSVVPVLLLYTAQGVTALPNGDQTASWIHWGENEIQWGKPFALQAGEERLVHLEVSPPGTEKEQDYPRAIVFQTIPGPGSQFSQSMVQSEVASILLINLSATGSVAKSVQLLHFEAPSFVDSFGPITISIEGKNNGNTFTRLLGEITFTGSLGTGHYGLIPHILLPGESSRLTSEASEKQSTATFHGLFLGKYTLEAKATLDQSSIEVQEQKVIYAFPWKLITLLLIVSLAYSTYRSSKK